MRKNSGKPGYLLASRALQENGTFLLFGSSTEDTMTQREGLHIPWELCSESVRSKGGHGQWSATRKLQLWDNDGDAPWKKRWGKVASEIVGHLKIHQTT